MDRKALTKLAEKAAELQDQTKVSAGFEKRLPEAGRTFARFTSYIELGNQPQRAYKGQKKPDCMVVDLGFTLVHPASKGKGKKKGREGSIREIEVDGKKVKINDFMHAKLPMKLNEKARYTKLFTAMRYGRDAVKHAAQMLGDPYMIDVLHIQRDNGDGSFATFWDKPASRYLIQGPYIDEIDPETSAPTGELINIGDRIKEPEDGDAAYKLFLWDNPTMDTWNSLFIDGERTIKVGGAEKTVTRNFIQATILRATNFEGSPTHVMLEKEGIDWEAIRDACPAIEYGEPEEAEEEDEEEGSKKNTTKSKASSAAVLEEAAGEDEEVEVDGVTEADEADEPETDEVEVEVEPEPEPEPKPAQKKAPTKKKTPAKPKDNKPAQNDAAAAALEALGL